MGLLPEPRMPGYQWRNLWGAVEPEKRRRIGKALRAGRAVEDREEAALERQLASREIALYLLLLPATLGVTVLDATSSQWSTVALWGALTLVIVARLALSWRAVRRIDAAHDDLPRLSSG